MQVALYQTLNSPYGRFVYKGGLLCTKYFKLIEKRNSDATINTAHVLYKINAL